jgi:microcystin-dependent protein
MAEIRMFGFTFAPRGWAACDGQLLPINQYQSLFSLLGTTYGGDGRTTFGLPELRGRSPMHEGPGFALGQKGGEENHILNAQEMPTHKHQLVGTDGSASTGTPTNNYMAKTPAAVGPIYTDAAASLNANFNSAAIGNKGSSQGHNNMQPYLVIEFCIALQGLFPSRN